MKSKRKVKSLIAAPRKKLTLRQQLAEAKAANASLNKFHADARADLQRNHEQRSAEQGKRHIELITQRDQFSSELSHERRNTESLISQIATLKQLHAQTLLNLARAEGKLERVAHEDALAAPLVTIDEPDYNKPDATRRRVVLKHQLEQPTRYEHEHSMGLAPSRNYTDSTIHWTAMGLRKS